jgi:hypothetical protein
VEVVQEAPPASPTLPVEEAKPAAPLAAYWCSCS